ncbi:MAG TPA: TauD/TfdA family dioxygenase [Caulobacteraceae bacterium]|jgi:alpha-ketoglutarate-dependent taurine dioxygenase|nr:TauD/TfdA family dioxygenase [Caulobacteraceae bacterium]
MELNVGRAAEGFELPPGVSHRAFDAHGLPLILEPVAGSPLASDPTAVQAWYAEHHTALEALLPTSGGVVLRGFAIPDTASFNAMIECYDTDPHGYAGGLTPRKNIAGKVFEASRVPADQKIILHQEMGYLPNYPRMVVFYCLVPAASGGCTTIGDIRRFQRQIPDALMASVRERGVLYRRNYRAPGPEADPIKALFRREWTDVLQVTTREQAEAACAAVGCEAVWEDDGSLSMRYRSPGFVRHPVTGEEVWFAQVQGMHFNEARLEGNFPMLAEAFPGGRPRPIEILYGDGGDIPEALVTPLYPILDALAVNLTYEHGDFMLLDNIFTAHGRERYTGERNVQVGLVF